MFSFFNKVTQEKFLKIDIIENCHWKQFEKVESVLFFPSAALPLNITFSLSVRLKHSLAALQAKRVNISEWKNFAAFF